MIALAGPSTGHPVFASILHGAFGLHTPGTTCLHSTCHLRTSPQSSHSTADAPLPISTGKLRHLQEIVVTKPHRKKPVTRRKKHKRMYIQCSDELHANMFQDYVGHVYAQRKKCSWRVKQCLANTRKNEALPRLLAKFPRLPWNNNLTPPTQSQQHVLQHLARI
jgi:hypothetical protein